MPADLDALVVAARWRSGITTLALGPHGRWIVAAQGHAIRQFDARTGVPLREIAAGADRAVLEGEHRNSGLAIAADGTWLATWADRPRRSRRSTPRPSRPTGRASRSPAPTGGSWCVDLVEGFVAHEDRWVLRQHGREPALSIAPDGTWLAAVDHDRTVRLWEMRPRRGGAGGGLGLCPVVTLTTMIDASTWRRERGVVGWKFWLPTLGTPPIAAMEFHACRFLAALRGFAVPVVAWWTTTSAGKDAVVHERGTVIDEDALVRTFREHPDIEVLAVDFDLVITATDGVGEAAIVNGGSLYLELMDDKLVFHVDLNVDVHFRRTHGRQKDNETLGRLNEPRLLAFVYRLRELGAFLEGVDPDSAHREQLAAWPPHMTAPARRSDLDGPIFRTPEDDTPRLALADLVRPSDPDLAAFISLQVAEAQRERVPDPPRRYGASVEERALLGRHQARWAAPLAGYLRRTADGRVACTFHRGFVAHVVVDPDVFIRHRTELFTHAPIRHVDFGPLRPGALAQLLACDELALLDSVGFPHIGLDDAGVAAIADCRWLEHCLYLDLSGNRLTPNAFWALAASPYLRRLLVVRRDQDPALGVRETWTPGEIDPTEVWDQPDESPSTGMKPTGHMIEAKHGYVPWLHVENRVARFDARWFVDQGLRPVRAAGSDPR